MKWPQIVVVLLGVVAVALAVRSRQAQIAPAPAPHAVVVAPAGAGQPLPPSFDRPGVASRQVGLLRIYLAVTPEVSLEPLIEGAARRIAAVPITVVLENDSYQPLSGATIGWLGQQLCAVRVSRVPDGERERDVFQRDLPLPARSDWLSAERRIFNVDWPLRDADPGLYRVSVQLAAPDQPSLEIFVRLL